MIYSIGLILVLLVVATPLVLAASYLLLIVLYPVFTIMSSMYWLVTHKTLNRYYIYSKKMDGYELHFHPFLGYYFADRAKYLKLREHAVNKLKQKYPNDRIFSTTYTLQEFYEHTLKNNTGVVIKRNKLKAFQSKYIGMIEVLYNFYNHRKTKDKTQLRSWKLIKRIYRSELKKYIIQNQGGLEANDQ